MKIKTKILSLLLALTMLFGMLPAVYAEGVEEAEGDKEQTAIVDDETENTETTVEPEESEKQEAAPQETETEEAKQEESSSTEETPSTDETSDTEETPNTEEASEKETESEETTEEPVADSEENKTEDSLNDTDDDDDDLSDLTEEELAALGEIMMMADTQVTYTYSISENSIKAFHLDCGRKYFSVEDIEAIIDTMYQNGYNTLELAVGNDGLRFLLNDMSVTVNGTTYSSDRVKAAIQAGNKSYYDCGEVNELTQSEMDEIIAYAAARSIKIMPLVNTPGHMDAILSAATSLTGVSCAYSTSKRTIDVSNSTAVAFSEALVQKYITYFAGKGCRYFNIGADEYANDTGSMGFATMGNSNYSKFVAYVNDLCAKVTAAGMIPVAYNDGIYYNQNATTMFDTDLVISYWSSGWSGYNVASATYLAEKGHRILNTNGDWYTIIGDRNFSKAESSLTGTAYNKVMGSGTMSVVGAMICYWCDTPSNAYNDSEKATITSAITAFANANTSIFDVSEKPAVGEVTVWDSEEKLVGVTAEELVSVTATAAQISMDDYDTVLAYDVTPATAEGAYTGEAKVQMKLPDGWKTTGMAAFVVTEGNAQTVEFTITDGYCVFTAPHFSEMGIATNSVTAEPEEITETITLEVGETAERTLDDGNYENEVDRTYFNSTIATVEVEGTTTEASTTPSTATKITAYAAGTYIIGNGTQWMKLNGSSITYTTNKDEATVWTVTGNNTNNNTLKIKSGNYYLRVSRNGNSYSIGTTTSQSNATYIRYFTSTGLYYKPQNTTYYLRWSGSAWQVSSNSSTNGACFYTYTAGTNVEGSAKTDITFTGVTPGTTYITVGETTYKIIVTKPQENVTIVLGDSKTITDTTATTAAASADGVVTVAASGTSLTLTGIALGSVDVETTNKIYHVTVVEDLPPADALTTDTITIETWITNSEVYNNTAKTSQTYTITSAEASSDEGVRLVTRAPGVYPTPAYAFFDGTVEVFYWTTKCLDSEHTQTNENGDDETGSGVAMSAVRYHNNAWQYKAPSGKWEYVKSSDQLVSYYLQKTEVTKEVTTFVKDWGFTGTSGNTPDWSGGKGQVVLSMATVYPDGTLSPNEDDIFPGASTVFNFWEDRNVGVISPANNDDYEIEKITYVYGTRTDSTTSNTWNFGTSDVSWNKTTTASGSTWFDETEVWNDTMNTVPTVNGPVDNVVWQAKNTGILILVYLKPVEKDSNLKVVWQDDTANAEIKSQDVVVTYEATSDPITFLNGLVQTSAVNAGTITLDDNAYITNSSKVNQTFNKDLTTMQGIAGQYTSGLYNYVSADISEDGKTLTLHYTLDTTNLSHTYVLDFGLPVSIPLTDFVPNLSSVKNVITTSNASYSSGKITFKPTRVLTATEVVTVRVEYISGNPTTLTIGFMPATTVYYEEGFATYTGSWYSSNKGTGTQTASFGYTTDRTTKTLAVYGYDAAYNSVGASNGTQATSSTKGDCAEFTFVGTGVDIYMTTAAGTGSAVIAIENESGSVFKLATVYTAATNGETEATANQAVTSYGSPVYSITGLARDTYTVSIYHVLNLDKSCTALNFDGFRVHGTLATDNQVYKNDLEDDPTYIELRDQVLTGFSVANDGSSEQTYGTPFGGDGTGTTVAIVTNVATLSADTVNDLLTYGPKNELYLQPGQAVTFSVSTSRKVEVGMHAVNAATTCTVNSNTVNMNSSVDMFYAVTPGINGQIVITNTGSGVLGITKIKVCDEIQLNTLTQADIDAAVAVLMAPAVEEEKPAVEEKPTEEQKPATEEKPKEDKKPAKEQKPKAEKPVVKPGKPNKPVAAPKNNVAAKATGFATKAFGLFNNVVRF